MRSSPYPDGRTSSYNGSRHDPTGQLLDGPSPRGRMHKFRSRIVTLVVFTFTAAWVIAVFVWEEVRNSFLPRKSNPTATP